MADEGAALHLVQIFPPLQETQWGVTFGAGVHVPLGLKQ
tara:strand:- start:398 stop:514 length:117 start_codon:yes stop_codon:yes gene_type:complete